MEDDKLIALLDEKFAEVRGEFAGVKTRLDGLETEVRKLRVDAHENNVKIERNNELMYAVDQKLENFRTETAGNFKDVKQMLGVANRGVVARIRKLEKKAS